MLYDASESASLETARYLRSIKAIKKGRGKKVDRAHQDLSTRLSDPEQVMLRRLWWGRQTWERFLSDLQEAASLGQPSTGELLGAYRDAWANTQQDWDRWHEHFRHLREELKSWLSAAGQNPVPLDLGVQKPSKEVRRAEKEFERQLRSDDSPEDLLLRSRLALALDYTLMFDVEWGATFDNRVSQDSVTWPWEQRWPHEFEGMGEWRARSGEPLLGTVVRLMNGRGAIRTGQWLSDEVSAPGALIQTFQDTQLIVCDDHLLVLQRMGPTGSQGAWATVDAFPYHQIDIPDSMRPRGRIEISDPKTGKSITWFSLDHLRKPLLDSLLEAKSQAEHPG